MTFWCSPPGLVVFCKIAVGGCWRRLILVVCWLVDGLNVVARMLRGGDEAGVGLDEAAVAKRGWLPASVFVCFEWTLPVAPDSIPSGVLLGLVKIFGARTVGACGMPMFDVAVFDLELDTFGPPAIIVRGGPFESAFR